MNGAVRLFASPALAGRLVSGARLLMGHSERNEGFRRSFAVFCIRSGGNMGIPDIGCIAVRKNVRTSGAGGTPKRKRPHRQTGAGEVSILETGRQVMKSAPASP
ncbi:protein of unknown function [Cupriavidus taiwanensis]|nr:protein of unknown function [Cupriavidus taiwanensis]